MRLVLKPNQNSLDQGHKVYEWVDVFDACGQMRGTVETMALWHGVEGGDAFDTLYRKGETVTVELTVVADKAKAETT